MKTAFFALNPLWNCFDRGESRNQFAGHQEGVDPLTGKMVEFQYGPVVEAPYHASDEEISELV